MRKEIKGFGIIALVAIIGLSAVMISCESDSSPTNLPPLTISDLFTGVHEDGIIFSNLQRSLRFWPDGTFITTNVGLFPTYFPFLGGRWEERVDEAGYNIIDIFVAEDFVGQANNSTNPHFFSIWVPVDWTEGDLRFSFRYVMESPSRLRIEATYDGIAEVNNNAGTGAYAVNTLTVQLGLYTIGIMPDVGAEDFIHMTRDTP